jgi:hypothetical protein
MTEIDPKVVPLKDIYTVVGYRHFIVTLALLSYINGSNHSLILK